MLKSDVIWPNSRRFKSRTEWEPLGFFSEALCNSTQFDLKLGFFSSSAINVLADGFAAFLYNGGKMRMIINDILSTEDKRAIIVADSCDDVDYFNLQDLGGMSDTLSKRNQHFFECLAWLIRHNRIEIKVVVPKAWRGHSPFQVRRILRWTEPCGIRWLMQLLEDGTYCQHREHHCFLRLGRAKRCVSH